MLPVSQRNIFKERLITDNNSLCYHFDESQIKLEFFSVNIVRNDARMLELSITESAQKKLVKTRG